MTDPITDVPTSRPTMLRSSEATDQLSYVIRAAGWAFGLVFVGYLFLADIVGLWHDGGRAINGWAIIGRDFANVFTSGHLVLEGRLGILYDNHAYQEWQARYFGEGVRLYNYSYSPITLLYTPLFALMPYLWSLGLWQAISIGAFTFAARPWLKLVDLPVAATIVLPTTLVCVWAGHYGLLIGALWLGTWHNLARRPALAGFLAGLMIVKPHLAILLPLVFIWRRQWVAFGVATATVVTLVALSILVFGPTLWATYLTQTAGYQLSLITMIHSGHILMMPGVAPALFAYGLPSKWVWAVQGVVALGAMYMLWRHPPKGNYQAGLATAVATFLVIPYGFNYDMTVIGLTTAMLLYQPKSLNNPVEMAAIALMFALPTTIMIILNRSGLWIAPPLLAMLLYVLLRRELFDRSRPEVAP